MTPNDMQRGLELCRRATELERQLRWVLLKSDSRAAEVFHVGEPSAHSPGQYGRRDVPLPDEARRLAFRIWRRGVAMGFNAVVRELNQLGVRHGFALVQFDPSTTDPIWPPRPERTN